MHEKLRKFLEANGLRADASEKEAWDFYAKMKADGVEYSGPEHIERDSEAGAMSAATGAQHRSDGDGDDGGDINSAGSARTDGAAGPEDIATVVAEAIRRERERCTAIEDACAVAGLSAEQTREMVESGMTVDMAREKIFEHLRSSSQPFGAGTSIHVGTDSRDKFRRAVEDGISLRAGINVEDPADGSREFRSRALHEIARECLERAGERTAGLSRMEVVGRALATGSTSDFPQLMSAVAGKTLIRAYNEWPQTWRPFVGVTDANDFKDIHAIKMSEAPDLQGMDENGEYKTAKFSDSGETYRVITKGIRVPLTRQMIINDDLRAFTRIPQLFGTAARRMEGDAVYSLITSNPTMSDGVALFHADHSNLGSAAAIDSAGLAAGRAMMRRQKGANGASLDVTPAFLLVAVEDELDAEILLRSAALPDDNKSAGVYNPWAGKLTPIADPHLTGTNWYLLAHPNQYPVIEVAYLMGEAQPYVDEQLDFNSDAMVIKVRHDFGAGVVDHIGAYMNPGV